MDTITLPGRAGGSQIAVDLTAFSESIRHNLMLHGLQQKVADAAANAQKEGWAQDETRAKCMAALDALMRGEWSRRATGPRAIDEDSFILGRVLAKIRAKIKTAKASMPADDVLRAHAEKIIASPDHAAWIAALRAEYAAKNVSVDLDDLI